MATTRAPARERIAAVWWPTFPKPCTATRLSARPRVSPLPGKSSGNSSARARPSTTPRPVASPLPRMPPWLTGFPVTQAKLSIPPGCMASYVSAIQAISLGPVPRSGAGTFTPGPIMFLRISSAVYRRVIRST